MSVVYGKKTLKSIGIDYNSIEKNHMIDSSENDINWRGKILDGKSTDKKWSIFIVIQLLNFYMNI